MIRYFFYVFGISLLFSSCEKDINIQLNPSTTDLVVDGSIENDKYPVVVLSRSLEYFNTIDPATLAKHFVHGAQLKITNDTVTAYLKEDSVINDSSGLVVYFYTFKPSDTTTKIKGQLSVPGSQQVAQHRAELRASGNRFVGLANDRDVRK